MNFIKVTAILFTLISISPSVIFGFDGEAAAKLRGNIPKLTFQISDDYSDGILEYFNYYNLDIKNAEHYFGYYISLNKKITAHIFSPNDPVGTIVFVHGYLDHSGLYSGIIRYFIEENFNIAIFDQPGHGLSEGIRMDIEDFSEYGVVLNDFVNLISGYLDGPYYAVGHSTGAAALIEYFNNYENLFELSFMVAPLIHSYMWNLSRIGIYIASIFSDSIFRRFGGASSDTEYLDFVKNRDPLQSKTVPFHWGYALHSWNEKITAYTYNPAEIVVLQGLADTVVDFKYNRSFLQDRFRSIEFITFADAKHSHLNEKPEIQQSVFNTILEKIQ
ncbi:MAG: alpha/beta hydrolase [Spirochaetales bacterium]|nr:alpha/beta hydrolase [Spirochaetales bacterium]